MTLDDYSMLAWKNTDDPADPAGPSDPYLDAGTLNEKEQQFKDVVDAIIGLQSTSSDYTDENARDAIASALVAGSNVTITPDDTANTITISVAVPSSYSDEQAQDAVAALVAAGTHSGITFTYNDASNSLSATVSAQSWSQITGKPTFAQVNTTDAPQSLGTSSPGVGPGASAADHVHTMPSLGQLDGVSTSGASSGQVLGYNGTSWAPATPSSGGTTLAFSLITASGTYTSTAIGTYEITVVGGGGSGGGGGSALTSGGVSTQRGGGGGGSGVRQKVVVSLTASQIVTFSIGGVATGGTGGTANGGAGGTGGQGNTTTASWTGGSVKAAGGAAGSGSGANSTSYAPSGNPGQPFFQSGGWPGCGGQAQYGGQTPGGIEGCATGGGPGGTASDTLGGGGGNGGDPANAQANGGSDHSSSTTAGVAGSNAAANSGGGGGGGGGGAPGGGGGAGGNGAAGYATIRQVA